MAVLLTTGGIMNKEISGGVLHRARTFLMSPN
jgi:hypothetical protein